MYIYICIYIYINKSVRELSEAPGRHRADASPEINEQENKRAKTENTGKDQSKNGKRPTDGTPINRKTENGNSRRKKNRGREQRTGEKKGDRKKQSKKKTTVQRPLSRLFFLLFLLFYFSPILLCFLRFADVTPIAPFFLEVSSGASDALARRVRNCVYSVVSVLLMCFPLFSSCGFVFFSFV